MVHEVFLAMEKKYDINLRNVPTPYTKNAPDWLEGCIREAFNDVYDMAPNFALSKLGW